MNVATSASRSRRRAPQCAALLVRRANGDLYIGDLCQGNAEEIDYLTAASPGLENDGWDVYQGRSQFEDNPLGGGKLVMPVAT